MFAFWRKNVSILDFADEKSRTFHLFVIYSIVLKRGQNNRGHQVFLSEDRGLCVSDIKKVGHLGTKKSASIDFGKESL
jgi:hypothetical protein